MRLFDTPCRRWLMRLCQAFAGACAAVLPGHAATARTVEAGRAPAAWIAYAQGVSATIKARLDGDDPAALHLRSDLRAAQDDAASTGSVLKLAVWIDATGRITRITHPPLSQGQSDSDLQSLIVGLTVAAPPPKGMLLPLRLSIHVDLAPSGVTAQPGERPSRMTATYRGDRLVGKRRRVPTDDKV